MKIKTNPFEFKVVGNAVEVWLGKPNEIESEFVCCVAIELVPQLIRILSLVNPRS